MPSILEPRGLHPRTSPPRSLDPRHLEAEALGASAGPRRAPAGHLRPPPAPSAPLDACYLARASTP
eukprot:1286308-Pyramimonas_sp.AAC.1